MRIGILFGGKSREREISFAGGRTVYDLLDKSLCTPVPIFIDSLGNFIELDWQYLYKGSIRDFYPPVGLEKENSPYQIYIESLNPDRETQDRAIAAVGKKLRPDELKDVMDFAFLALHGPYGEDGSIQGILDFYDIPYSGSGIFASSVGINKHLQKELMRQMGIEATKSVPITRTEWLKMPPAKILERVKQEFELPVVVKSSSQGSSIGVSILKSWDEKEFEARVNQSFFILTVQKSDWANKSEQERKEYIQQISDSYIGTGIPFRVKEKIIHHPLELQKYFENHFATSDEPLRLESLNTEPQIIIEEFIDGKEFSCIVVEGENGEAIALPPTEIIKSSDLFDYRAKYLPGISRKVTPINLPEEIINKIRTSCEELYKALHFDVYARIDGLISNKTGTIYLNDPNTTSGMLPSSFFFHQAAEIGLSPSQFLSYIVHRSMVNRLANSHRGHMMQEKLTELEDKITNKQQAEDKKFSVSVVLGGISSERHISVESGRNVFEKLSSSGKFSATPIFLVQDGEQISFYKLPMNLLLKDNADDIKDKVRNYKISPIIEDIIAKAEDITQKFAAKDYEFYPQELSVAELKRISDAVFIGLHGRPGEDGTLQKILEAEGIPYNGSSSDSSSVTINKYLTNEILKNNGFLIPEHFLVKRSDWVANKESLLNEIEAQIKYPLIAKPADDGCSSAVKKVDNREELINFVNTIFRPGDELTNEQRELMKLKANEEFPCKDFFVVEELVGANGAKKFLEVTGGLLTHYSDSGEVIYEMFEPSEALAQKGILSLEEKFLAGEGQNITPARFAADEEERLAISQKVQEALRGAAIALNIEGYCRIDAFVRIFDREKVDVIFIEVNSLPGLTPATCIFHQAAINGYKPAEFLGEIIDYGVKRTNQHVKANA